MTEWVTDERKNKFWFDELRFGGTARLFGRPALERLQSSRVLVVGIGKSGHLARKIAATLSSTGTASFFMHGTEALHGDLGGAQAGSYSVGTKTLGTLSITKKQVDVEVSGSRTYDGTGATAHVAAPPTDAE